MTYTTPALAVSLDVELRRAKRVIFFANLQQCLDCRPARTHVAAKARDQELKGQALAILKGLSLGGTQS